jgi:hopanoid biosynthesis associated radical SAM protein HpnH
MGIPVMQGMRIGTYLMKNKIQRRDKFPLIVELEPLYACNLKCNGCGKIQQTHDLLRQRMPVERAIAAMEECGAPMVSIAGGEPLMHPQIDVMVNELVKRKKYVYLCTNAELVRKRFDRFDFKPSRYFSFAIHIDGLRDRHDESVAKEGVFDEAVAAIRFLKEKGFRVTTNSTFFTNDSPQNIIDVMNFLNDEVRVDSMMLSPAYAYEKAPDQDHFLGVQETRELFSKATPRSSSISSRGRSTSSARRGGSRRTPCSAGRSRATSWTTATSRRTRSSSRRPTGRNTAGAATSAATTAWPTAATSRRPSWPPWARCARVCAPCASRADPRRGASVGPETERMPGGAGVDGEPLGAVGIVGGRARGLEQVTTQCQRPSACLLQVLDVQVEVHLLLLTTSRPLRPDVVRGPLHTHDPLAVDDDAVPVVVAVHRAPE